MYADLYLLGGDTVYKLIARHVRRFKRDEKANLQAAFAVITLLVGLSVGVLIFSQVTTQTKNVATQLNDTQATNFITDVVNIGYNSMQLLMIGAIVLAAVVVLGYVAYLSRGGGEGV